MRALVLVVAMALVSVGMAGTLTPARASLTSGFAGITISGGNYALYGGAPQVIPNDTAGMTSVRTIGLGAGGLTVVPLNKLTSIHKAQATALNQGNATCQQRSAWIEGSNFNNSANHKNTLLAYVCWDGYSEPWTEGGTTQDCTSKEWTCGDAYTGNYWDGNNLVHEDWLNAYPFIDFGWCPAPPGTTCWNDQMKMYIRIDSDARGNWYARFDCTDEGGPPYGC